ncbi:aminopeptidase N [Zymobacter palmae]|uniref:Aminopeptidase N n=1 Tax=Zymobacter palmae TaxID=33074 RepID=A0A348HEW3_9GAMM|nr:aminopeptidase N [Zymobacter palmae]BBG30165.1 aminopeptidase N [Zymobacter palmae]
MSEPEVVYLKDYLPPAYTVETTHLTFELAPEDTHVKATLRMKRHPEREAGVPLELFGANLDLRAISLNGEALSKSRYRIDGERLIIDDVPDAFVLDTEVVIAPEQNTALEGLYRSNGMYCTQCEPEGFRRITWYPDRPDVMAKFTTTVIGDKATLPILLSNGNPIDQGDLEDGRHFVTWEDPFPKPSYLFALVAGQLEVVESYFTTRNGRTVLLQLYVEPQNLHKTEFSMGALKRAMKWDEETYGREYDLDRFMIVAVDDFNMGAMENKGLNIFNSSAVLANPETTIDAGFQRIEGIVAHEYFHNWSGNRVTCRDWFQLALKEGFTVFRDQTFSADTNSAPVKRIEDVAVLRTQQFAEDAGPTAHPVRPDHFIEISNFYTLTVYEKGAEVVRMLRNLLGKETFRRGTDTYFERFDGQAVRVEDFVNTMADVSGIDLGQFMRWYEQAGTPRIDVAEEYDAERQEYALTFRQHTPATPGQVADSKQPLHIPVRMGLLNGRGNPIELAVGNERPGHEMVLELREAEERIVFKHVAEKPTPSLLRGFSAPVILNFPYTREQLAFLVKYDVDGFNRWDAGQRLAQEAIFDVMHAIQAGEAPTLDDTLLDVFDYLLKTPDRADRAVLAEMLQLPSEAYLAGQRAQVDIDAIHDARAFVERSLAEQLHFHWQALYESNVTKAAYEPSFEQISHRALKNVALSYLCATGDEDALALADQQFKTATNMTDTRAALTQLVHRHAGERADAALKAFEARWSHDPLVMDQWLTLQATQPHPEALDRVKALMAHPAFSLRNPNRVRALIGAFSQHNHVNFHRADGEGYALLADIVLQLNKSNPEIAARLVLPLTRYQRLDEVHQQLMRGALERIRNQSLSRNLYEVIEKALA